jgi:hypothetical protein
VIGRFNALSKTRRKHSPSPSQGAHALKPDLTKRKNIVTFIKTLTRACILENGLKNEK